MRALRALFAVTALACLPAFAPFTAPERAPRLAAQSIAQLQRPLPMPYDDGHDARRDLADAIGRARASGKLLLIDFGANWCLECRVLAGILALPDLRAWMQRHYEVVTVSVGRFDRNMDIPAALGQPAVRAIPAVYVIDPRTARLRNAGRVGALGGSVPMRPQPVANWLAGWTR